MSTNDDKTEIEVLKNQLGLVQKQVFVLYLIIHHECSFFPLCYEGDML